MTEKETVYKDNEPQGGGRAEERRTSEYMGGGLETDGERQEESSQDVVCVLEIFKLDDCLEMVTREMPKRTSGEENEARLPQDVCHVELQSIFVGNINAIKSSAEMILTVID